MLEVVDSGMSLGTRKKLAAKLAKNTEQSVSTAGKVHGNSSPGTHDYKSVDVNFPVEPPIQQPDQAAAVSKLVSNGHYVKGKSSK